MVITEVRIKLMEDNHENERLRSIDGRMDFSPPLRRGRYVLPVHPHPTLRLSEPLRESSHEVLVTP